MKLDLLPHILSRFPLGDERPWYVIVDFDLLQRRFHRLSDVFDGWLHAPAVKAHPLPESLAMLVAEGAGLEAASWGEVELAMRSGCGPAAIVFDSPAKTVRELRDALDAGVTINADNLDEIERIAQILEDSSSDARVGLRINPEVAPSSIGALSTGSPNSKFGVSLSAQREEVTHAFEEYRWLDGLHVHIGSKGYGPDELARGVAPIVELARELGARRLDIGGGLPPGATPTAYRRALTRHAPELLSGEFEVITEIGRWLFTHCAIAVSRVEYVKPAASCDIATIHFGADFMLRNAYQPGVWSHPVRVFHPDGTPKRADDRVVTIGGPLCFGGDVIAREIELPCIAAGDVVAVRDVGAYTFGMWSTFCSRPRPEFVIVDGGEARLTASTP